MQSLTMGALGRFAQQGWGFRVGEALGRGAARLWDRRDGRVGGGIRPASPKPLLRRPDPLPAWRAQRDEMRMDLRVAARLRDLGTLRRLLARLRKVQRESWHATIKREAREIAEAIEPVIARVERGPRTVWT